MRAYARRHYGIDDYRLRAPKVIVEHVAVAGSTGAVFATFAPDVPDVELHELPNVCSHFVVGADGSVVQMVPLSLMCRHTVGLNYTAIGIEHVGFRDADVLGNARELRASLQPHALAALPLRDRGQERHRPQRVAHLALPPRARGGAAPPDPRRLGPRVDGPLPGAAAGAAVLVVGSPPWTRASHAPRSTPTAGERFVSLRRALGVTSFGINQMVLEPRQRGRIHRHERQEEVYLVLEGTLTLLVEGEEQALERGELVRVAPAVRRQLVNRGPERLVMLALGGDRRAHRARRRGVDRLGRARRAPAAGGPAARRTCPSSRRQAAGGWCSPKGEPWSSRQSLKRPWLRLRLLVALDVHVLDDAPELAHALHRRVDVVDREEDVGRRAGVAAVDAAAPARACGS